MKEKKTRRLGKKWILAAGIGIVVVAAAVVFILPKLTTPAVSQTSTYKTQALTVGSLTSTVGATGNVYTRQTVALNWQTSGIVSKLGVTKGQVVDKDTVLAELDQSSLPQSVLSAATDLATAQKDLDDLLNSGAARANAELALITTEQTLVDAQKSAQSKLYQRASQTTIDTAKANLIMAQDALDKAAEMYNQNKARSSDDVQYASALSRFAAAQQTFDQAQANVQYAQALPSTLDVQKANATVDVAQAAYTDAKRAWERVKDGPNAIDVAAAEAKVAAAHAILDEAKITAPIAGTVTAIDTQVGDLVSGQTAAFQIDDLSHLYVDISVSEVDINQVKVGQPVEITFDAIADKTYAGKVTDIAMQGASSSGAVNFNVSVEITDNDALIKPGMTASANVTVTQKTDVLLAPSSAIRTVDSQSIVYVMQNGNLRQVPITTGDTSSTATEVKDGNLQAGDLIVLNPPSTTTNAATTSRQSGLLGGLFGGLFGGSAGGPPGGITGGQPPSGGFQGGPGVSSGAGGSGSSSNSGGNSTSK
jgi:HlyD family secretion protein